MPVDRQSKPADLCREKVVRTAIRIKIKSPDHSPQVQRNYGTCESDRMFGKERIERGVIDRGSPEERQCLVSQGEARPNAKDLAQLDLSKVSRSSEDSGTEENGKR